MRCIRLFLTMSALAVVQLGMAQSFPDDPPMVAQEVNLAKSVHLFPNPATEDVFVELDQFPAKNVQVTVHTIIGNEIPVEKEVVESNLIRVRVKDLATGYYLLAVKDEESNFRGTYQFLKR